MTVISHRARTIATWAMALALLVTMSAPLALTAGAQDSPEVDLADLAGTIDIDGSSTVEPVTSAVAEEFRAAGAEGVGIAVGISGTGGGFERFCAGETDISDASRAITEDEIALCAENGVEYYEFELGQDGITVVVNPANDFVECVSTGQLAEIWAEDGEVSTFSDLNPDFADEEITLYGPGPDSGTFDFFNEVILGEDREPTTDYTPSEDDNVLVQGVAGDENALGYFGYAFYETNSDTLTAVELATEDDLSNCVEPSPETIRDGSYPISRPLFIYVNAESMEDEAVREFVHFYAANAEEIVPTVPYIALPSEEYEAAQERVEAIIAGDVEPDSASAGEATPEV